MSDVVVSPKRASLWREGLKTFWFNWREWSKTAVWYAVVMTVGYAVVMKGIPGSMPDIHAKPGQPITPEQQAMLDHMANKMLMWMIPLMVVIIVKAYAFVVFFIRKQGVFGSPVATIGGFFCWLGHYIVLVLIMMGVGVVGFGVPMALLALFKSVIPAWIPVVLSVAGMIFLYFIALRLYPVIIFSVCRVESLYKTSWKLTKGTCWRLIGNMILLMLICMVFWIALAIVFAIVAAVVGVGVAVFGKGAIAPTAVQATGAEFGYVPILIISPIMGVLITIFSGILWAFYCTAMRIFYEEKRQEDPSFVLAVKA